MLNLKNSKGSKLLALGLALIFILGAFTGCGGKKEPETTTPPTTQKPTTTSPYLSGAINPLTGAKGYDEALLNQRPVFVSVENHPAARPQWGITSADIVFETVVEGGITRMLLMFADKSRLPEKVGPTRSARHYFVEMVHGFDAIFIHFGGSPKAYNEMSNRGTDHIDGMSYGKAFSRDTSRNVDREHRAYTTKDKVISAIDSKDFRTEIKDDYKSPFKFNATPKKLKDGTANEIKVPFSSSFTYTLTYNNEDKLYYSSLRGNPFKDGNNDKQQNFTNIIMCYVNVTSLGDKKGRVNLDLSEGSGIYASNGTYQEITWKKGGYNDMLKFYDKDGKELAINSGRTYLALVPTSQQKNATIA